MSQRTLRLLLILLFAVAIVIYVGYSAVYVRYTAGMVMFPFDIDQGEGNELNNVILFARGQTPYASNEVYPFYATNYTPVYHLLLVPFVWLFGPALWYGRLFSFLTTLVSAAAIAYMVYRATQDKPVSVLSGLAFLASNYVYHIGALFRQHVSMIMWEALAVAVLATLSRDDTAGARRKLGFGLLFLLLAFYTKQLAYMTVAVCMLFVIWRGFKRGLVASALLGGVGAAVFVFFNIITDGHWWINVITSNIAEFVPGQMEGLYRQWYDLHLILIWLAVAFVGLTIYKFVQKQLPPDGDQSWLLYSMWFIGSVVNGALSGKWGAGESYFVTSVAAMCLCAGILLGEWRRAAVGWRHALQWATAVAIPLLFIMQAGRLIHMPTQGRVFGPIARALNLPTDVPYYDSQGYSQLGRPPNAIDIEQGNKILAYAKAAPGDVLSEEAMFAILAGKEQITNGPHLLDLAKVNALDMTELIATIEGQRYDLIILKSQFYPPPVLHAMGQYYEPMDTIVMNNFPYYILKPRADR